MEVFTVSELGRVPSVLRARKRLYVPVRVKSCACIVSLKSRSATTGLPAPERHRRAARPSGQCGSGGSAVGQLPGASDGRTNLESDGRTNKSEALAF